MDYQNIKYEVKDSIAYITMNRPKALNALNAALLAELRHCVETMYKDVRSIRGVIITGEGRSFVAGADITELLAEVPGKSPNVSERFMDVVEDTYQTLALLENYPRPVIAAINGFALGGGLELALACDIRIASTKAQMGLPEATLGLIPTYGGTQRLPRLVGIGIAKELIYTCRKIKADEAEKIGLVNMVVEPEELIPTVEEMLRNIAKNAPLSIKYDKIAINRGMQMSLEEGLRLEKALGGLAIGSEDAKGGIAAFLEKRTPVFEDK